MDRTAGIVGLGIMGGAIARNLVERGWRVIGFDTDAARRAELALANVTIADNVGQVARDAPNIMTSLPGPVAVEDVAQSIAASGQSSRIVVELSTLAIADKLRFEATLRKAGHIALDCPLSGTGAQAKNRDLIVYASGDSDGHRPVHGTVLRLRQAQRRSWKVWQWQPDEICRQSSGCHTQCRHRRGDDFGRARRARSENGRRDGRSGRRRLANVSDARANDGRRRL